MEQLSLAFLVRLNLDLLEPKRLNHATNLFISGHLRPDYLRAC
jgi:hypothetical protein